jgi:hypothetical protein
MLANQGTEQLPSKYPPSKFERLKEIDIHYQTQIKQTFNEGLTKPLPKKG